MSTSVQVAYNNPNSHNMYCFQRNACFGQMNRLSESGTERMEVMEWHPRIAGRVGASLRQNCTPRKAFKFIEQFGMWEDVFRVTTINTVAADLREHPIDCIITGFMSMRDFQEGYNSFVFPNGDLGTKIEFAMRSAGIYRNRYASPFLELGSVAHGEGGVCSLPDTTDALSLYLLVYGTKEDFQGCWAQGIIGVGANREGYVRDSSNDSRKREIRVNRPSWTGLADWLRCWLSTNPDHLQSKLGRLTIRRFYEGLSARLNTEHTASDQRKAEIINNSFEELREMYA